MPQASTSRRSTSLAFRTVDEFSTIAEQVYNPRSMNLRAGHASAVSSHPVSRGGRHRRVAFSSCIDGIRSRLLRSPRHALVPPRQRETLQLEGALADASVGSRDGLIERISPGTIGSVRTQQWGAVVQIMEQPAIVVLPFRLRTACHHVDIISPMIRIVKSTTFDFLLQ